MADRRARRRRVLYLLGLVPALLMLLVSFRLALLLVHQERALSAYEQGELVVAQDEFEANKLLNPVERWVAPFGEGGARYQLKDYAGAVDVFEVALSLAPADKECVVRVNLALAHEGIGDAAATAGDRADAEVSWTKGIEVLSDCALRTDDEDERVRRNAEEVGARLAAKLGEVPPSSSERPKEPPTPDDDFQDRKRQLEEQNEQAREERRDSEEEPEPPDSPDPQW